MPDTLVAFGGAIKVVGDDGVIGGYLVTFGNADQPDLSSQHDFFSKSTDFDFDDGDKRSIYFGHGLDAKMGKRKIGKVAMKVDDVGVWVDGQLNLRDEYERAIYGMVKQGKLGWSSGAPSHLVERKSVGEAHEILHWPIAEGSLTPTPAEPRCDALSLKSLSPLIGMPPTTEDHTKNLPSGMSYDNLLALLQDELNEDFPDDDDDGEDTWGPGLDVVDVYDDNLVYRDEEDLYRIPYTVTPGNDVVWGTAESVVRTTVYQTATDGDDAAGMDDTQPKSLIAALPVGATFDAQLDAALAAVEGVIERGFDINEMRIKSGRVISAGSRAKLKKIHGGMQAAHALLGEHVTYMSSLLDETQPPVAGKKQAEVEYIRFLAHEARRLGVAV